MSKPVLTTEDFESAADELGCSVPAIMAVCEIESPTGGFLPDGRPTVLLEKHKFFKFTQGAFLADHPDICSPQPGGYAKGRNWVERQINEWNRAQKAIALDKEAALLSCSFLA